jgi:hypothetical protein
LWAPPLLLVGRLRDEVGVPLVEAKAFVEATNLKGGVV